MTDQEMAILNKIADIHNDYLNLPAMHQHDLPEWIMGIHNLQRIIATNEVRRQYPETFNVLKK